MEPKFKWEWHTDDAGEYIRVIWYGTERPDGVEVCRMVVGRTDDRTGCRMRAEIVCDAMRALVRVQTGVGSKVGGGPLEPTVKPPSNRSGPLPVFIMMA